MTWIYSILVGFVIFTTTAMVDAGFHPGIVILLCSVVSFAIGMSAMRHIHKGVFNG